ncbi:MAG: 4-hydroxy-3-methylbut-2-enyl diphosphate reductase [Pseudomonadota bacterium]
MEVLLANPRGFCAGVDRAIEIVERALELYGPPIYVRHEVVHNKFVVDGLREKGAVFVEELDDVPDNSTVIFSAHGVSRAVEEEAARRQLDVFDATCPLVTKVHLEVNRYARQGREVILIGHAGHPEVVGTMGRYDTQYGGRIILVETVEDVDTIDVEMQEELAFVSQTTLSVDDTHKIIEALKARFPSIQAPRKDDICYATQNRQDAVKDLCKRSDVLLVVGATNSSNSNRLRELGERNGIPAYLIANADAIDPAWVSSAQRVGVTAGASAPEILVQQVVARLQALGGGAIEETAGIEENVRFAIPRPLRRMDTNGQPLGGVGRQPQTN